MFIDPLKAVACLAWILAFAYSWAPFDLAFAQRQVADNLALGTFPYLTGLAVHMLAFAGVGAADRVGVWRWNELRKGISPRLPLRGLLFCVLIEVGQLFVPARHSELADLVVNAAGVCVGHLGIVPILSVARRFRAGEARRRDSHALPMVLLALWTLLWSSLLLIPSRFVALDDWDQAYPLVLGSEQDGGRSWKGDVQYVALYDRPLRSEQIAEIFKNPPAVTGATASRSNIGLLVAYDFSRIGRLEIEPEGQVGSQILPIRLSADSRWNVGGPALELDEDRLRAIATPAASITGRIASSGAFSVEIWCRSPGLIQRDLTTIVGVSDSVWRRNFAIGQQGQDLYFQVRNRLNGPDGRTFELRFPGVVSTDLVQIVATYSRGVSVVFKNANRLSQTVDLREPSVLLGLGAGPASHFVTALICSLSLIVAAARFLKRRVTVWRLATVLLSGCACLMIGTLAIGTLLSFPPSVSLYTWAAPGIAVSLVLTLRRERPTPS